MVSVFRCLRQRHRLSDDAEVFNERSAADVRAKQISATIASRPQPAGSSVSESLDEEER
jgi:hypothetical protein